MKISTLELIVDTMRGSTYAFDQLFRSQHQRAPKLISLYEGLLNGDIVNDNTAAQYVYGGLVPSSRLTELKKRLYKALTNLIATLPPSNTRSTELQSKYLECINQFYAAHLLSNISYSGTLKADILNRALRDSKKYEFTELTYLILSEIIPLIGTTWVNSEFYEQYISDVQKYKRTLDAERKAREAYNLLLEHYSIKQTAFPLNRLSDLEKNLETQLFKYSDITTHRFLLDSYFYRILKNELRGNLRRAVELCDTLFQKLHCKPYRVEFGQSKIALRIISICIKLKDFTRAEKELSNPYIKLLSQTEVTRAINIYAFILRTHQKQYIQAFYISRRATTSSQLKTRSSAIKELWHILDAYAHFFAHTGLAKLSEEERAKLQKFRIYKFLNDVPVFSKDKRGMNITILILHVLFLLWNKRLADASDRITALKVYSRKYLIQDETYRSNCFIKMLIELDKADFHPIRGQRYAQKYCDRLAEVPLSKSLQGIEVEIVPYEHLWEMVIDLCERNLKKK